MEQRPNPKYRRWERIRYHIGWNKRRNKKIPNAFITETYIVRTHYDKYEKCYFYLVDITPGYEWVREDDIIGRASKRIK